MALDVRLGNDQFLTAGGEMAELIRSKDWSKTPLGPMQSWSQALRTVVSLLLSNRFPMLLWWGPDYIQIYNDAYRPVPGSKHPRSLGQPARECWPEIWHIIGPLIDTPFRGGPATWMEDIQLEINRHDFFEETHFTIAYSPVPDQSVPAGIGGVLATVHEITQKVIGERRIEVLRDLGTSAVETKSAEAACAMAAETLARHPKDIPFALLYLIDPDRRHARLAGAAHISVGTRASPVSIELTESQGIWPLAEALSTESLQLVDGLGERFGVALPGGPWSDPPDRAVIVPIRSNIAHYLAGFLVVGISSRLQFDQAYESFVELAATQIANAIATARAYEEERQRAEALAELDRVKTAFFSNVSHEFRTPLTLMLGPVEELLSKSEGELSADVRSELQLVNRNAYRLLRLVNTLLDFSRIEAGRTQASYEPVDVGEITADLASVFRAATERAGLELIIDCPKLAGPVFVDRDMWEKIVLNLISNAFKFTFEGAIEVSVRQREDGEGRGVVELQVRDTGVGIPPEEMPRLFDRFHRIESTRSRTHEGTGIGLALVQELVKLHGGSVRADSVLGKGTLFTVSLPLGSAHLPAERIGVERTLVSTNAGAVPFVEEALRWLPEAASDDARSKFNVQGSRLSEENIDWELRAVPESKIQNLKSKILVADDNADMRQYLTRILSERYDVTSVPNGKVAIEAARERLPDLVLSDVMMPELDGFGLLKALRADQRTAMVPIVLLSARAGEESRVEGMEAGADDYLTKPFSARELLARVSARLEIARIRREAAAEQQAAYEALREADRRKDEFLAMLGHELRNPFGIISNGVQLLRRIAPREPKLQDVQEMIERQLAHTSRLLDDLLDVSRIARGKIQLERQSYRLDEIVRQTLADHRSVFEERKIRLDAELPEGAVWVLADSTRIAQAFGNLLSNAAKFTDASGTVAVKLASERDEFAVLSVRDTGMGIEPEFLGRIFESFIQAESSLDRTRGGLGLGLALVKGIIELHGGRVSASSDGPGRGSEFTIRLPLDKSQSSKALSPSAEHAGIRPYRILLIEDNQLAARSTRLLLEQFGHTVEVAHDGIVGLEIARRFHPEVILCDIGLPGLDGYGVASSLREQLQRDGAYLVAVSGYAKDEGRAREAGFNVHLTKPINFRKLEELLARFAANVPEEGETGDVASVAVTRSTG